MVQDTEIKRSCFAKHIIDSGALFFLVLCLVTGSSCSGPHKEKKPKNFHYDFNNPARTYWLDRSLTEVSGLSFASKDLLALIEDENGILFYFDLAKGEVTRKITFGKDGDYEDVEVLGDTAWILRSDGKLFQVIPKTGMDEAEVSTKFNTGLSSKNNTEGLCYDKKNQLFLVACKGSPDYRNSYNNKKAIYAFNPVTGKLSDDPFTLIDLDDVEKKIGEGKMERVGKDVSTFLSKGDEGFFQPSGIAIHPLSGEIYVISSVGNLLVILDSTGGLKAVIKLPPSVFKQPEGIAFDDEGNLFISNEGRKGSGNILKFLYSEN